MASIRSNGLALIVLTLSLLHLVVGSRHYDVATLQHCTTRYCNSPAKYVPKWTRTVQAKVKCAVTRTTTVVRGRSTKYTTKTTTAWPTTTHTVTPTVYSRTTIWTSTTRPTRRVTSTSIVTVSRGGVFTRTITPTTRVIPTPPGFVAILDDPDNDPRKWPPIQARDAAPAPAPDPGYQPKKYPTAIVCTKTLQTKTATSYVWKTIMHATSVVYDTKWRTIYKPPVHKYTTLRSTRTIKTRISAVRTIPTTSTTTVTTTTTLYSSTVTTTLPQETFYAACGPRNRAPPPDEIFQVWSAGDAFPSWEENSMTFKTNDTDYECCVACQTYKGADGPCVGSYWSYLGIWGNPCSPWPPWPECETLPDPQDTGSCTLVLAGSSKTCKRQTYQVDSYMAPPRAISNGPGCKRYKRRNK